VMADTDGYSLENWVKHGHIEMTKSSSVGRGKERRYSLKNCVQISAMRFLVDSGERPKTAAVLSLKVAELGEKYIESLQDYKVNDDLHLEDLVMAWSGDPMQSKGTNKLVCGAGPRKSYIDRVESKENSSRGWRDRARHSVLEAGWIIRESIEGYYEIRDERII